MLTHTSRALTCGSLALALCACADDPTSHPTPDTPDVGDDALSADAASDASVDAAADAEDDARDATFDVEVDVNADAATDGGADADTDTDATDTGADTSADTTPPELGWCDALECGAGVCDATTGTCACPTGSWFDGFTCADVQPCEEDACAGLCPIVRAPSLRVLQASETLVFSTGDDAFPLQVGIATDPSADAPDAWVDSDTLSFDGLAGEDVRVFARVASAECTPRGQLNALIRVRDTYPGPPDEEGSTAVPLDHPRIIAWAASVFEASIGDSVDESWRDPSAALGPAERGSFGIVSLGDGGYVTLGFAEVFGDGPGFDLAVFENSFADNYLEVGTVEVSSDGVTFVAFDTASTNDVPTGAYGYTDTRTLGQLAGKYRAGFGTPFDLAQLRQHPAVAAGALDLNAVRYVRVRDLVGDGSAFDSFGRAVFDPHPTQGSTGFDLDAVAVLGEAP